MCNLGVQGVETHVTAITILRASRVKSPSMVAGCRKSFTRVPLQDNDHSAREQFNRTISRVRKIREFEMGKGGGRRESWIWTHAMSQVPLRINPGPLLFWNPTSPSQLCTPAALGDCATKVLAHAPQKGTRNCACISASNSQVGEESSHFFHPSHRSESAVPKSSGAYMPPTP